jgi:hypothetical protein
MLFLGNIQARFWSRNVEGDIIQNIQKPQAVRKARTQTTTAAAAVARRKAAATEAKVSARRGRAPMSDGHKQALAEGREQGRGVRLYLEALEKNRPKRGRKRTSDSIAKRLDTIGQRLADADPLTRLHLIQERINLQNELEALKAKTDLTDLEEGFIASAKSYGRRKGITQAAWRSLGVPADVLRKAGITRSE